MFSNVSWADYCRVIGLAISLYYLFVGFRYYPREITEILTGKRKLQVRSFTFPNNQSVTESDDQSDLQQEEYLDLTSPEDLEHETLALVDTLKVHIERACENPIPQREFMSALKSILKDHSQFQNSQFQQALSKFILSECEKHETITLSENDVVGLWVGAG